MNDPTQAFDPELRGRARLATESADYSRSLCDVWRELIAGERSVADAFLDQTHCYLVLCAPAATPLTLSARHLKVLEHVLRGDGQKPIAIDLGLSYSTIATVAKQALNYLGLHCIPSRVPLSLVVAAQASNDSNSSGPSRIASFELAGRSYDVVRLLRPDTKLTSLLPPAEVEVVRARVAGETHRQIARLRKTSMRTMANQLASAARRLGVSGRLETINLLLAASRYEEQRTA